MPSSRPACWRAGELESWRAAGELEESWRRAGEPLWVAKCKHFQAKSCCASGHRFSPHPLNSKSVPEELPSKKLLREWPIIILSIIIFISIVIIALSAPSLSLIIVIIRTVVVVIIRPVDTILIIFIFIIVIVVFVLIAISLLVCIKAFG